MRKENDSVWGRRRLHGSIVSIAMSAMHLLIIESGRRRPLTRRDLAQDFGIGFEKGIPGFNQLSSDPSDSRTPSA